MSEDRYTYNPPTLHWNPEVREYFLKAYSSDHFARISKALTTPSIYSCIRVNFLATTADVVIHKLLSIMRDQNLQIQTLNPKPLLLKDALTPISSSQTPCIFKCQLPPLDYLLFIQGSGPHRLRYQDAPKEVIVSRKCAEAVLRGAQVFVPGVLACSSHVEKGDRVAVSVAVEQLKSDSQWSVGITRGTSLNGSNTDPHYIERKGLYIGQGTAMMSRSGIFRSLKGVAVELTSRVYELPSFHDVLEGEIFLQNLPSIIVAHALDPQEGESVLDMCAAPGGKTTAIGILMGNKGKVIATDRSHNKVIEISNLASEMGLTCINAYRLDALKSVCKNNEVISTCASKDSKTKENTNQATQGFSIAKLDISRNIEPKMNGPGRNNCIGNRARNSKGFLPHTFDRVLLDAPCSALGLRPRLFVGEETLESLVKHARYQRKMFDQAVQLVRPGGVIVYSTCTINPGENEALVRYALDTYKFLSLAPQHPRIGGPGLVGHCELSDGKNIEKWLTPSESELVQRFDPCAPLDTIGFFIAKFNVGNNDK